MSDVNSQAPPKRAFLYVDIMKSIMR